MTVRIICIGKIKETFFREALDEYIKRLGRYCKTEIVELPESRLKDKPSDAEIASALSKEAEDISERIKPGDYVIALCIEGKQYSSEELAKKLEAPGINGKNTLTFIIGSSFGLDESIKRKADMKLSFSEMTFPHQLMRVILAEQIYRSFSILNNTEYHK